MERDAPTAAGPDQLAVLWAAAAGLAAVAATVAPHWVGWLPTCRFRELLSVPCPGCGSGRALLLFAAGRPLEAFALYPLPSGLGAAFLLGGLVAGGLVLARRPLPRPGPRSRTRLRWALAAFVAAGWCHGVLTGI